MRRPSCAASCLAGWLLLAAGGAAASAQAPAAPQEQAAAVAIDALIGKPIAEVHVTIDGQEVTDQELLSVLETEPATPLSTSSIRESIMHLMALARFQDVRVDARLVARGVALTYQLTTLHTVKSIEFRGELGLTAGQLRRAVEERYTASPPVSRSEEIAAMLAGLCRDHGFLKATVTPSSETESRPDRLRLVFEVHAGSPALIGRAVVDGASGGESAEIVKRLDLQPGKRFDRVALEGAIASYVAGLRAHGYLQAKMDPDPAYSENREQVDVTIRLNRGPRIAIAFRGDPLPDKRKEEILALLRDGVLDEDVLENEQHSIEEEFRSRGYRDVTAPYHSEKLSDDQLQIVFVVNRGPQYKVSAVEVSGNQQLSRLEIQPALRVAPGQWYVKARVDADARSLQDLYRKQGFRSAAVTSAAVPAAGDPTQLVTKLDVNEGPRTLISAVECERNVVLACPVLKEAIQSREGGPYYAPQVENDREAILYEYQARGYQQARVEIAADGLSPDGSRFKLRFIVDEGPQSLIDHILIVGNVRTKAATIERALDLRRGMPLAVLALADAQRRVSALGLFRRVQVTPLERNIDNRRDVLVTVEEAPVNTIAYGGGLEGALRLRTNAASGLPEELFDLAPRGFFEVGRRNLWGKNRSVSLFLRGAIRSSDQYNGTATNPPLEDTSSGFREYRVLGTYREPRFLDLPVDLLVSAGIDQAIRSTFDFNQRRILVEGSHRFGPSLSLAGRYSFGHTRLFNERIDPASQLDVDKVFPRVQLSELSGSAVLSTRDDAFEPTRGYLAAFDLTFAPRAIGSEVGFVKGSWQGFLYKALPHAKGVVAVGGVRLGLAQGFPQVALDAEGKPLVIDQELPASERFFAGGDSTVRSFALDRLGTQGVIDQNGVSTGVLDANGVSNGGNGLLIFNGELRFPVWAKRSLGGAVFIDVGNVFKKAGDINLGELRSGAGFGLRWKSPVGPLRVDFAWKLNPIVFANGTPENAFAWYVTIGQAF
jgi:outer membrane protein insertion porin family